MNVIGCGVRGVVDAVAALLELPGPVDVFQAEQGFVEWPLFPKLPWDRGIGVVDGETVWVFDARLGAEDALKILGLAEA